MSHLLVATDFSEVADNAIHYACEFARDMKMPVTILHSFIIPVTFSDTPMPVMPVDEGRQIAEDRMNEVIGSLRQRYEGLVINSKIMFGDIVDCIDEYTEESMPVMVIVGNSGTGDSVLWLGSNVLSALQNLHCTVMAVPPGVTYKKPQKLCFACDFKNIADHLQTENLVTLVQQTGTQLHVVNVDHHNKQYSTEMPIESTELHTMLSSLNPVYHYVEKENVEDGIREFIESNQMDWLIIVPHKHYFFEGLFHKSHTKAIVKILTIPLIAIHEK